MPRTNFPRPTPRMQLKVAITQVLLEKSVTGIDELGCRMDALKDSRLGA